MPSDFPPWDDTYGQFRRWRERGLWPTVCAVLNSRVRQQAGRDPDPSLLLIDT